MHFYSIDICTLTNTGRRQTLINKTQKQLGLFTPINILVVIERSNFRYSSKFYAHEKGNFAYKRLIQCSFASEVTSFVFHNLLRTDCDLFFKQVLQP